MEPFQRQDRSSCVVRREELFTLEELKRAGGRLKATTAPGIDGVPNEILERGDPSISGDPPRSLQLLSSGGEILRRLEEAEICPAEEGQQTSRGSLIVWVTGKRKGFYALVSIDIRNAFNTARWNICIEAMMRKKVPDYLLRMIDDYLSDRWVIYEGDKWSLKEEMTCG